MADRLMRAASNASALPKRIYRLAGGIEAAPHPSGTSHLRISLQGHTRLASYNHLGPRDKDAGMGIKNYQRMRAIPALICSDPTIITRDQPRVKRLLGLVRP